MQTRWSFDEAHPALAEQHCFRTAAQDEALQQARATACSHARRARTYAASVLRASAPVAASQGGGASEPGEPSARRAAQGALQSIARAEELSKSFSIRMRESPVRAPRPHTSCGAPVTTAPGEQQEVGAFSDLLDSRLGCVDHSSLLLGANTDIDAASASPDVPQPNPQPADRLNYAHHSSDRRDGAVARSNSAGPRDATSRPQEAHRSPVRRSLHTGDAPSVSGGQGASSGDEEVALGGFSEARYDAYSAEVDAEMAARRAAGEAAGDVDAGAALRFSACSMVFAQPSNPHLVPAN